MADSRAGRYTYRIEWDVQSGRYVGRCLEFPSLTADGETQAVALDEISSLVETGIDILEENRDEVPSPLSERKFRGRIPLRVPPATHRRLAMEAAEQQISLNQHLTSLIEMSGGYEAVMIRLKDVAEKLADIQNRLNALEIAVASSESVTAKLSDEAQIDYSQKLLGNLQALLGTESQWGRWISNSSNLEQILPMVPISDRATVLIGDEPDLQDIPDPTGE